MTIQELIKELQTWPPNTQVRRADSETDDEPIDRVIYQPTRDPLTLGYIVLK